MLPSYTERAPLRIVFDNVIGLKKGCVESGTHKELLAWKGLYSNLYDTQFNKTEEHQTKNYHLFRSLGFPGNVPVPLGKTRRISHLSRQEHAS
jgi:hypothetical protein